MGLLLQLISCTTWPTNALLEEPVWRCALKLLLITNRRLQGKEPVLEVCRPRPLHHHKCPRRRHFGELGQWSMWCMWQKGLPNQRGRPRPDSAALRRLHCSSSSNSSSTRNRNLHSLHRASAIRLHGPAANLPRSAGRSHVPNQVPNQLPMQAPNRALSSERLHWAEQ